MTKRDEMIIGVWMNEYLHPEHNECSICGNSGFVDTTGLKSPRGDSVGRKHYCICPNGRKMKQLKVPFVP